MPVITEVYRKDDLNINEIVNENIIKILEKEIHYDKYCSSKR